MSVNPSDFWIGFGCGVWFISAIYGYLLFNRWLDKKELP